MTRRTTARLAGTNDADDVARLLHDFNTEFDTPTPGVATLTRRVERLLAGTSIFAIIAGTPPVAVAVVSVRPNVWYDGNVALLDELYVDPRHRNDGIGSAIIELVRERARAIGVDAIEINVDEHDVDAQRFYERHGYSSTEPDSTERAFYYFQELRSTN